MKRIIFSAIWRRVMLATAASMLLFIIFVAPIVAQQLPDESSDTPPVCVYPATCYVNQAYDGIGNGSVDEPFAKFTVGMNVARERGQWYEVDGQVIVESGHYAATGVYTYPTTITAPTGNVILERLPNIIGDVTCSWKSSDCNRCVPNVPLSFSRLRNLGSILGYNMDVRHPDVTLVGVDCVLAGGGITGGENCQHWQGVQRLTVDDGRYLLVTRNHIKDFDDAHPGYWSGFAVVHMGSRNQESGSLGDPFGSNRLSIYDYDEIAPPDEDVIVWTQLINDEYAHPGGVQVMGNILAVGLGHHVHLYDLGDPTMPIHGGPLDPESPDGIGPILKRPNTTGSSTSMAKLASGHYLLIVANSDAESLDFYLSHEANLLDGEFSKFDRWGKGELVDGTWNKYQSLNLVTDCWGGQLYLIGTYQDLSKADGGADLYKLSVPLHGGDEVELIYIDSLDARTHYKNSEPGHLQGAGGVYVDQQGQLHLYTTEFENLGPRGDNGRKSVEFMEFSPSEIPCTDIADAWVELFNDDFNTNWWEMIEYDMSYLRNYEVFSQFNYDDKAAEARWCIPSGWSYALYPGEYYLGDPVILNGNSDISYKDFKDSTCSPATYCNELDEFIQEASSSCWINPSGQSCTVNADGQCVPIQ